MKSMIIVNFGGPRSLKEVESFLIALLTDRDVIRTRFPDFFHRWFFTRIARKRAEKVKEDYSLIGGKSPIFEDTEAVACLLAEKLNIPITTFHRYLVETHAAFLHKMQNLTSETLVFPLFPQFSFATTGSIARFFHERFPTDKLHWIKSYSDHPAFVAFIQNSIRKYLKEHSLKEEETILLFSAHGIPRQFVDTGDPYEQECLRSFRAISSDFKKALSRLSYQSKFGKGEWLRPYTDEVCKDILKWSEQRKHVLVIPLSFTSDHVETLFEIEYQYLPLLRQGRLLAHRLPAPNRAKEWIDAIASILKTARLVSTESLIKN